MYNTYLYSWGINSNKVDVSHGDFLNGGFISRAGFPKLKAG